MITTLKLYLFAIAGIPLGIYCLAIGSWFGAGIFGGIGVLSLSQVLPRHVKNTSPWLNAAGLVGLAVMFLSLVGLFFQTFDFAG
jgi:hypothetical protein